MNNIITKNGLQEDGINLFEYFLAILKYKEFVIKTTLAAMLIATVVSIIIPSLYLAETKILPPQGGSSSMASVFATQMGGVISPATFGIKNTNDLYIALLKTRGVSDYVATKLDLMKSYKVESRETMREILKQGLRVQDDRRSGIIIIGFTHRNPQIAADIVNAYVEGLQNLNNSLAVTEASQRRLFFEDQLKIAKENLIRSEDSLKSFQQRTGTIKIDDETKAVMGTVAEMRAKVSAKEVELRVMRAYATAQNPDMQRLQTETSALKEELLKLESKTGLDDDSLPTVGKMSALGTEYVRKMRDYRYSESLYEIFMRQFEAAKLDEAKDAALVQIVEKAEVPESRISPKRRNIVFRTGALVFLFSIGLVILKSLYADFVSDPTHKAEIDKVKDSFASSTIIKDLKLDIIGEKIAKMIKRKNHEFKA